MVETDVSTKGIGNLKVLCTVLPPFKISAAIPVVAAGKRVLFFPLKKLIIVLYKYVFPEPPGPSRKKNVVHLHFQQH